MKPRFTLIASIALWGSGLMIPLTGVSQARLVINNNAWVRIDNGAWVVLENPATTALQTLGTGGNIRSEGEFNRIRWQIRNSTGVYTVPFTTANGVKMPFTYEVTTAGSNDATASIAFSTFNYGTVGPVNWNNDTYRPSDVTHMFNYWVGSPLNNSDNVVDRFWEIDPYAAGFAYTAKPTVRLGFTYDPGAVIGDVRTGNAITGASVVGAQRFNPNGNMWGDYWPAGTWAAGAVNSVTAVDVPAGHFFRSWTLSNILQPLPVELVRFDAQCIDGRVAISWSTASENGSDHFDVQRSVDGITFETIGQVTAAGQSMSLIDYSYIDNRPLNTGYYRVMEVDADGSRQLSEIAATSCSRTGRTHIVTAWDGGSILNVLVETASDQVHLVRLFDAAGKEIWNAANVPLATGQNTLSIPTEGIAFGVYTVRFDGPEGPMARRIVLR
ncbi:MAG: hypothetical protein IPL52_17240 [Flavobacteriales bacterium]|nr:hypothetical protein [Flavobacteriales bacterium]